MIKISHDTQIKLFFFVLLSGLVGAWYLAAHSFIDFIKCLF